MELEVLVPLNRQVVSTKNLKSLGLTTYIISKLVLQGVLEKTRRGFYKVNLQYEVDEQLMSYYLMNNYYDEFIDYFNHLPIKDYLAYYYRFMYDIMLNDYASAYKSLAKCCELNVDKKNKINLYAYILLLNELMNLSNAKLVALKNKVFKNPDDSLQLFLECLIQKDYDGAYKNLRFSKNNKNLTKLDIKVLRNLSIKANECYHKKISPEMEKYEKTYDLFYECLLNNDFEGATYYFNIMYHQSLKMGLKDKKLDIISDLFNCFNYIVAHPEVSLESYKTNFKYTKKDADNFYLAINNNDYISALKFAHNVVSENNNKTFTVYYHLLERIYNFLNIRSIIKLHNPNRQLSLNGLIKEKRYDEALTMAHNGNFLTQENQKLVVPLLESLVALDDNSMFNQEN